MFFNFGLVDMCTLSWPTMIVAPQLKTCLRLRKLFRVGKTIAYSMPWKIFVFDPLLRAGQNYTMLMDKHLKLYSNKYKKQGPASALIHEQQIQKLLSQNVALAKGVKTIRMIQGQEIRQVLNILLPLIHQDDGFRWNLWYHQYQNQHEQCGRLPARHRQSLTSPFWLDK